MITLLGIAKHQIHSRYSVLTFYVNGSLWRDTAIIAGDAQSYLEARESIYAAQIAAREADYTGFVTIIDENGVETETPITLEDHMKPRPDQGLKNNPVENVSLLSNLAELVDNLTFDKVETHIDTVFSGLPTDQKNSLKNLYRVVLYLAKRG